MTTHSSILSVKIPWKEKPGGDSPCGHKELDMTEVTEYACMHELSKTKQAYLLISQDISEIMMC